MIRELKYEELPMAYREFISPYFPANEVKPLDLILEMYLEGFYKVLAYVQDEKPEEILGCAFITFHPGCKACLLDYYAIAENCRGKGYGSKMLKSLTGKQVSGYPIMIETEAVEQARSEAERKQRIRRNAFYERNGAKKTELITWIFGVYYTIWILGDAEGISVTKEMADCYRYMVKEERYKENCRIPAQLPLQTNGTLI